MTVQPIVTPPDGGDILQFSPTELLTWKATLDRTQAFDQLTLTAQPGHAGAPEHVHSAVEECFYVLDGAFRFKVAGSIVLAEPGTFLFVPRGVAHTWTNALDVASTMLLTFIPGGMKAFFTEAAPLMHAEPLDLQALTAVNARHATTVTGPPLAAGPLTPDPGTSDTTPHR
jgi:mannose-6-phosphate isomerase-like protein (cupin superfamily)